MGNIAIIPARSGSKGLKDKNVMMLNGKPLIAYSIIAARESGMFDEVMVSTDSIDYAEIAKRYGAKVPFLRSEEMSSDVAGSWEVVREVLQNYKNIGKVFDTVCLLQPTSPLRVKEDIVEGYKQLGEKKADAITAMCECDHSPLWTAALDETLSLAEFRQQMQDAPRQSLTKYYRINGALYIRRIVYSKDEIALNNCKEYAIIMERERSVDIDTQLDFDIAEMMIKREMWRI